MRILSVAVACCGAPFLEGLLRPLVLFWGLDLLGLKASRAQLVIATLRAKISYQQTRGSLRRL